MNRLLKNIAGQFVPFFAETTGGVPLTGVASNMSIQVSHDGAGLGSGSGTVTELNGGAYLWAPSQADTNADVVTVLIGDSTDGMKSVLRSWRTETTAAGVVLAAVQPNYAPAKAGDAMTLAANQDVRHVLGNVAGNLLGGVVGAVGLVSHLDPVAVDELLDRASGVQAGLTVRQALRNIVASLVTVSVSPALTSHSGPTSSKLAPKFPPAARRLLAQAAVDVLKVIELNGSQPELGLLAPNLATAFQQLAAALDAIRTQSA